MRKICAAVLCVLLIPIGAVDGAAVTWAEFKVPYASLKYAMDRDIETYEQDVHCSWIAVLALAATYTDGNCGLASVKKAYRQVRSGAVPSGKAYDYYYSVYNAVLGGMLGNFSVEKDGVTKSCYGLKAFSPIAAGYGYSHCDDFGASRTYGFARCHLGNDLMGGLGTPITAVESGVIEAMGWNQYGGWRVGIRSFDGKRYYYYAHLQKDKPFAPGLAPGDTVEAGQLIGFMGRTGYSTTENVNNIETVHLHFGMELVFEEWQKECNNEIWIDTYQIVKLLSSHPCSYEKTGNGYNRCYAFTDLDMKQFLQ